MKKLLLSLPMFLILVGILIFYSEYKTRNFVDAFITSSDNSEEVVQGITIWEENEEHGHSTLAILKPGDAHYEEVLSALSGWEVKRALSKDKSAQKIYQVDLASDAKPMDPLNIQIASNGTLYLHGYEYKLVKGSSIEEIIEMVK